MHDWYAIIVTLLSAIVLTLLPLPEWAMWVRPAWVLMVLIYWAMVIPYRVGVGMAWIMGIVLDLLTGTLLGEHALAMTVVIYLVSRLHLQLRMYPLLQQGMTTFVFVLIYQFILYCIQGFIGDLPGSYLYWVSAVTSMLFWPWLYLLLRDCRRWFRIA